MKLANLFHNSPRADLLRESSTYIVLGLQDPATGAITRLTITADMVALPDEATLMVRVNDESAELGPPPDYSSDYVEIECSYCLHSGMVGTNGICWFPMPISDDESEPCACRCATPVEVEPLPTWAITPDGQEFEVGGGGLF